MLLPPSRSSANKCLLVSTFWTQPLPQHLVSVAYLFSTTAGLTLASFVLGLAVLRELTLSQFRLTVSEFEEEEGVFFSVSVFSFSFKNFLLFSLDTCWTPSAVERPGSDSISTWSICLDCRCNNLQLALPAWLLIGTQTLSKQCISSLSVILYSISPLPNPSSSSVSEFAWTILRQNLRCRKNKQQHSRSCALHWNTFYICFIGLFGLDNWKTCRKLNSSLF